MAEFIRVWKEFDIEDISGHLLVVGDIKGDCANCRELGIDYSNVKSCPKCGTLFKFIASRSKEVKKIIKKRPDLVFVDFEDYKNRLAKIKARGLLS